eukprot:3435374-Pleurochrysis_carterae.AAC.1
MPLRYPPESSNRLCLQLSKTCASGSCCSANGFECCVDLSASSVAALRVAPPLTTAPAVSVAASVSFAASISVASSPRAAAAACTPAADHAAASRRRHIRANGSKCEAQRQGVRAGAVSPGTG